MATHLAPETIAAGYGCGPVKLNLVFEDADLRDSLHGLLSQYDAPWPAPAHAISITIARGEASATVTKPSGAYLRSYRLHVERRGNLLISLSQLGVWMEFDLAANCAQIVVPFCSDIPALVEETEQQLVLLLARAWAQAGWTPLHAG